MNDAHYPFRHRKLEDPSRLQRLLRRPVRKNAFIEITNLLATDILDVTRDQIQAIAAKYKIYLPIDHLTERQSIFRQYLAYCYADNLIDNSERERLNHLIALLYLKRDAVEEVKIPLQRQIYQQAIRNLPIAQSLSSRDLDALTELQEALVISDELAEEIHRQEGIQGHIDQLRHDTVVRQKTQLYMSLMNSPLDPIPVPLNLDFDEVCYLAELSSWYEARTKTRAVQYNGPRLRLRLGRGVYWSAGHANVNRITEEVLTNIDSGNVYFTNKRIIFIGQFRNTTINLSKILGIQSSLDGIEIMKPRGRNPFFTFADVKAATIVLTRLVDGDIDPAERPYDAVAVHDLKANLTIEAPRSRLQPIDSYELGYVDGMHHTDYDGHVESLIQEHRHSEAIELLTRLVAAAEAESRASYELVRPWYYKQLAVLFRKQGNIQEEIEILSRFEEHRKAVGAPPGHLTERLTTAQAIMLRNNWSE